LTATVRPSRRVICTVGPTIAVTRPVTRAPPIGAGCAQPAAERSDVNTKSAAGRICRRPRKTAAQSCMFIVKNPDEVL
jgi:hypothetical protein